MEQPLISIILPTYNGSRYIRQSIESCITQTYQNFELIIVNDCSTDDTPNIIEYYAEKDQRIKVIHNKFNKKLPLSLNTGFEAASGAYFTWTSDDNYYAPEALQSMLDILEKNKDIDLVYCDYHLINDQNQITGKRVFNDVNKSFHNWLGCGACFLYKAEVHKELNGYNPAAFLIEDYDFFVRAFVKFNFYYLPEHKLYFYREHAASLTATQTDTINDISKIFLERNLPGLEKRLPENEISLVYRKLAVYYAVTKSNLPKYGLYLEKLRKASLVKVLITIIYVFLLKFWLAIKFGFAGFFLGLKLIFRK